MPHNTAEPTQLQKIVGGVAGVILVICALEVIPGWGLLGFGWPPLVYILVTAITGAAAGWTGRPGYRLPGLIAGAIAGPGAILAMYLLMQKAERVPIPIVLVAVLVGLLPAVGVYKVLTLVQDAVAPSQNKLLRRSDREVTK